LGQSLELRRTGVEPARVDVEQVLTDLLRSAERIEVTAGDAAGGQTVSKIAGPD
jgi:hypothetical protein